MLSIVSSLSFDSLNSLNSINKLVTSRERESLIVSENMIREKFNLQILRTFERKTRDFLVLLWAKNSFSPNFVLKRERKKAYACSSGWRILLLPLETDSIPGIHRRIRHREGSFRDFSLEREWKFHPPVGGYRVI